ncbi:hypothetical protein [uncultured Fusobacterium sp.]|uniref:hypothetical protein n=1 Tax=uncultured Fusobacterium sp. TaxID=159267 RepID=UPI0025E4BBEA|nr:hypothetical protein [uncultured Fusobacterium sp.]
MYEGLTRKGAEYLAKCQAKSLPITFAKVKIGNGILLEDEDPTELLDIKSIKKEVEIANKVQSGETLELTVQIDNQGVEVGYYPREIGIYVVDEEQEILYWYINDGNECSWLPPALKAPVKYKMKINLIATSLDVVVINWSGSGLWVDVEYLEKELKTKLDKGNVSSDYDTAEKIENEIKKVANSIDSISINWEDIVGKPNSLPNPYGLTISLNGTSQGIYNGGSAKNINITASAVGALPIGGGTITGALIVNGKTTTADVQINGNLVGTSGKTISGFGKVYNAIWNDYAEFFERGEETETGDIIALNLLSEKEQYIKASDKNNCVVGVHSNEFAILIGGEEAPEGIDYYKHNIKKFIPVGLMGRVKCKVIGKIKKGEEIGVSHIAGVGIKGQGVGIALENKDNEEIGLIRILLKGNR